MPLIGDEKMREIIEFKINSEVKLPIEMVNDAPRSGPFDEYAEWLLANYNVQCSLKDSIEHLKEYGAWSNEELQDLELNKQRLLWIACMDIKEISDDYAKDDNFYYWYMGL